MRSHFRLFPALLAAFAFLVSIPGRAVSMARDFVDTVFLATDPARVSAFLRLDREPALRLAGNGGSIDATLSNSLRDEAGLSRLGSVRHT